MNRGSFSNAPIGSWRYYDARIRTAGSGGETQPNWNPDTPNYSFGRYVRDLDNIVTVQMQIAAVDPNNTGGVVIGAGSAYVFPLPFPARRLTGPKSVSHIPIGSALCYWSQSPAPNANVACAVTLANAYPSLDNRENAFCQVYAPEGLDWGSDSTASAATDTATHRLMYAPASASEIDVVTTSAQSNNVTPIWLSGITSTQFTINSRSPVFVNNSTYSWKIRAAPPSGETGAVVSPTFPWDWTRFTWLGPYPNIFIECEYEAA